jgi:hypothetical protein
MTDDTDFRSLLATMLEDQPPTRLTADQLVRAGRRRARWTLPPLRHWPHAQLATAAAVVAVVAAGGMAGAALLDRAAQAPNAGQTVSPVGLSRIDGLVGLSADGRSLSATGGGRGGPCHPAMDLVAIESATQVRLGLRLVDPPSTYTGPCTLELQIVQHTVRLAAPLGDRALLDAATGGRLAVLAIGRVGRPGYLPAGYITGTDNCAGTGEVPLTAAGNPPPGATPVVACSTSYYREATTPDGNYPGLSIRQVFDQSTAQVLAADTSGIRWRQPTPTTVHGQPALLRRGTEQGKLPGQVWYRQQLAWSERGVTIVLTAGGVDRPGDQLATTELTRVADRLHW